jgi:hypothetical protein
MGRKKKGHEDDPKIDKNIINLMLGDPKVIRLMKLWKTPAQLKESDDGKIPQKRRE